MVGVVAEGEAGPLLKAKTANSCDLPHWYFMLASLALSTDCGTGAPGVGKKTQCDLLSKKFDFQHISLDDVLREKSDDQTYLHAEVLKYCLEEKINVPTDLAISLLEEKINEGIEEGKRWSIVRGFPESMQELLEFKERVSIFDVNRALLTSVGSKNKLYTAFELHSRGNAPACRKPGTTSNRRWDGCCEETSRFSSSECRSRD